MNNEFLQAHIADALYTGRFGGTTKFHKADDLPHELYDWIKTQYPPVQFIRIGPAMGTGGRMQWWVGAWETTQSEAPDWIGLFWSEWRKL